MFTYNAWTIQLNQNNNSFGRKLKNFLHARNFGDIYLGVDDLMGVFSFYT